MGDIEEVLQNWTRPPSPTNTWTVYVDIPSTNYARKLLSRVVKCFIICREQSTLIKEPEDRTEWLASRKRDSWGRNLEKFHAAPSKRQNQCKLVDLPLQNELNNPNCENMRRNN